MRDLLFALLGVGVSLAGIFVSIGLHRIAINPRSVSWKKVLRYVRKMKDHFASEGWVPDVIVSFPKGGLIVADLLFHEFDNDVDVLSIFTRRRVCDGVIEVEVNDEYINFQSIVSKNILIVDDVLESGDTIRVIRDGLIRNNIPKSNIRIAVMGVPKSGANLIVPDFSNFEYDRSRGFEFPWGEITL